MIDFGIDFGTEKGAPREPFWEPKWIQKLSKNEAENEAEKKTLSRTSWVDLGTFWGAIRNEKRSNLLVGLVFPERRRFRRQDAFKSDPGAKKEAKRVPKCFPKPF